MSGRKIDDMGGRPSTSDAMMASKTHTKKYSSAEGAGHVGADYPDTTEAIKRDQEGAIRKIKSNKQKSNYRY